MNKLDPKIWGTVVFIAGAITGALGDGWALGLIGIGQKNTELELQSSSVEIERVRAVVQLLQEKTDVYDAILLLANEVDHLRQQGSFDATERFRLEQKLQIAKDKYMSIETHLAGLEGREPNPLRYELARPMPPGGLTIQ